MNRMKKAFTLVEILIVVIILGILAAIVIPQFTQASSDARDSAITSDLQTLRSQLALYKVQHRDAYPAAATFVAQMTGKSNSDGTTTGGTLALGPYMQTIPNNPVTLVNTLATGAAIPATGVATGGWFYYISADGKTANIYAYDNGSTSGGTLHVSL